MTTVITAEQVKRLREMTGAGMMECKKALTASAGDIDAAIDAMRKAGIAKAAKKEGRTTAEGVTAAKISDDGLKGAMVEVNCETDFVARSNLTEFANDTVAAILKNNVQDVEQIAQLQLANGQTVEEARQALINKVGENIQIRRACIVEATGRVGCYIHGARIGALVALTANNADLAKDVAMHVAASNPLTISQSEVPAELVAKEKEVFLAQSADSGKPQDIMEKMVAGRISKFLNEISLMGQPFVKDPNQSVEKLLNGAKAQVTAFVRYEVGEGIEKPVENFAEAVAQAGGGN